MKHLLLVLLLFILSLSSQAQQNLVPNPSFEDTVYCPWGTNQLDACANWLNFGNSPDYFNTCTGFGGPPLNYNFGFQYPHSGNAMTGIVTYYKPNSPSGPNYREYMGAQLISNMTVGQKYFFSMHANFFYNSVVSLASNKLGMNFSTVQFSETNPPAVLNTANLYTDSILMDSLNWIKLSGSFIADSSYQYLAIGNYFDDDHTDTINTSATPFFAYYYIDDICITTDSLYNEIWTGIDYEEIIVHDMEVFPNPTYDVLNLVSNEIIDTVIIYNLQGNVLANLGNINNIKTTINISDFNPGLIAVFIKTKSGYTHRKILIKS